MGKTEPAVRSLGGPERGGRGYRQVPSHSQPRPPITQLDSGPGGTPGGCGLEDEWEMESDSR